MKFKKSYRTIRHHQQNMNNNQTPGTIYLELLRNWLSSDPIFTLRSQIRGQNLSSSASIERIVSWEVTCPCRERLSVSHELKLDRYSELQVKFQEKGSHVITWWLSLGPGVSLLIASLKQQLLSV